MHTSSLPVDATMRAHRCVADKLLYDVTEQTPPPRKLGQFRLGARRARRQLRCVHAWCGAPPGKGLHVCAESRHAFARPDLPVHPGPSASCGDIISARVRLDGDTDKSEQTFVIKRVSYRYEYQRGSYRMVGKGAQVKMVRTSQSERCDDALRITRHAARGMHVGARCPLHHACVAPLVVRRRAVMRPRRS